MRDQHILQGQGFALVYAINLKTTLPQLGAFYQSVLRVKEEDSYPVVVIGNKCDIEKSRVIRLDDNLFIDSTEEGRQFAKSISAPFFEASGK